MSLDLTCRECQAGLAQIGQSALGFTCFEHGAIGIEVSQLMEMAAKNAAAPLEAQINEQHNQIIHLQTMLRQAQEAVEDANLASEFFNWFWYNEVLFPSRMAYRIATEWTDYEIKWRENGCIPKYYAIPEETPPPA